MECSEREELGDRFVFAVFLSICFHILIVLGVGSSLPGAGRGDAVMDVAVVFRHPEPPRLADFSIPASQPAGALEAEAVAVNDFPDTGPPAADQAAGAGAEADELAQAIASLQAELEHRQRDYAERPRVRTVSSLSALESRAGAYLDDWRKRVESVGNLNYPPEAQRRRLYGSLRLLVAQRSDGGVDDVRVLSSSGHEVLDQAAVDIVHMAAPFDPFPAEIRAEVDILEIIRTWRFHESDGLIGC